MGGGGVIPKIRGTGHSAAAFRAQGASLVTFDRGHATASNDTTRARAPLRQWFFLVILSACYQPGQGDK